MFICTAYELLVIPETEYHVLEKELQWNEQEIWYVTRFIYVSFFHSSAKSLVL